MAQKNRILICAKQSEVRTGENKTNILTVQAKHTPQSQTPITICYKNRTHTYAGTYATGSQTCIQFKYIYNNHVHGISQFALSCHKRRNFSYLSHYSWYFNTVWKTKYWVPQQSNTLPGVSQAKAVPLLFKLTTSTSTYRQKTQLFGHYRPKIIHKLCSSNLVSCALLIYSNEVMLLVAIC